MSPRLTPKRVSNRASAVVGTSSASSRSGQRDAVEAAATAEPVFFRKSRLSARIVTSSPFSLM
jgi:hypothetical protein